VRVCARLRECVIDLRVHFPLLQNDTFTFAQDAAEFAATLAVVCARVCVCVCLSVCLRVCACVCLYIRIFVGVHLVLSCARLHLMACVALHVTCDTSRLTRDM